jgi:hypothetical protein
MMVIAATMAAMHGAFAQVAAPADGEAGNEAAAPVVALAIRALARVRVGA